MSTPKPRSALASRVLAGEVTQAPVGTLFLAGPEGDANRFLVNMLSNDFAAMAPLPGWTITPVGEDVAWTPARCGAMPNVLIGDRWFAQFDWLTESADPTATGRASGGATTAAGKTAARLTLYDLQTRTFRDLLPAGADVHPFTATLSAVSTHQLAYLWSPAVRSGDKAKESAPLWDRLFHRTVDLPDLTYTDTPVSLPTGLRVRSAFPWDGALRLDLGTPNGSTQPALLVGGVGRPWTAELLPDSTLLPAGIDGYLTEVINGTNARPAHDALVHRSTGQVAHRFAHDRFVAVNVRAARGSRVYVTYQTPRPPAAGANGGRVDRARQPDTARDLGVVDLANGQVATAVIGADIFVAGVQGEAATSSSAAAPTKPAG